MNIEKLRKFWQEDNYFDIAIDEYKKFKNTNIYNEQYKKEILSELNSFFKKIEINSDNVNEVIERLKNSNPSKGSFVHWIEIDNLLKITRSFPETMANALNVLYDGSFVLIEKLKEFEQIIKEVKPNFRLGTPLIGYLLASFDYEKYPLYKDEIFKNLLNFFNIEWNFENTIEKYFSYFQTCNLLKDYFVEKGYLKNPNILDIQDFIYCVFSSDYQELLFKLNLKYLHEKSKLLYKFENDIDLFMNYLNNLDKGYLEYLYEKYTDSEKVNLIRAKIIELLINNKKLTVEKLEEIKEAISNLYDKDILVVWNNFRILFPLYYEKYKKRIKIILKNIAGILKSLVAENIDRNLKLKTHIVDFYGAQNFGKDECWVALFPEEKASHKKSAQLFLIVFPEKIEYGLILGWDVRKGKKSQGYFDDVEHKTSADELSLNVLLNKYKEIFPKFLEINGLDSSKVINSSSYKGLETKDKIVSTSGIISQIDWNKFSIKNLYFENSELLVSQILISLKSGKHIILVGPPGTGKSKLAKEICESLGISYEFTTALSDWSTFDTIGGYKPNPDGTLYFEEGIFLKTLMNKNHKELKWLIIDEINRADIDKAFGPLLSVLTGDQVVLSFKSRSGDNIKIVPETDGNIIIENDNIYVLPKDFRIIGTMNTYDKTSLYELSYAFMRRFAFVYIGVPKNINSDVLENYLEKWDIKKSVGLRDSLAEIWNIVNKYRLIGPAVIRDIAEYVENGGDYTSALVLYVLPQFEGLSETKIKNFVSELVKSSIGEFSNQKDVLTEFIKDFFGISME
ncbi:AAA family ATPase [Thermosipho atlanticus]|uniref:AAA domain (Dynein-related subfamily) n=1 Tax=Thermosipho atlanticus DSM 15807 TaxID=1123380 RepID=A0A1M5RCL2_9BACT|nr:AAA family ATPase [Thermosipho atlanticus]SHH23870.1 AAA domain (dynein-related subfamily) [Thermosipho atlanticus DSM 15807]